MQPIPRKLSDEDVIKLRNEKTELNRQTRRKTGMKIACTGKLTGYLECETHEGRCPDFGTCHGTTDTTKAASEAQTSAN
ncbi:MAG: hypothetical protein HQM10_25190 [Candidatus Riflebacteria bacterium]|nr:hypothetical protein [Candidatus Riflebacteria bacterium]